MLRPSEIDDAVLMQRLCAALKERANGNNRKGWIGRIADELNVHDDTVANWLHGDTCPSGGKLMALFALLGREFGDEILELAGLCCARIEHMEAVAEGVEHGKLKTFYTQVKGLVKDAEDNVVDLKEVSK